MPAPREATFSIDVTGEVTGEQYPGTFKVYTRLTHNEQLRADQLRRELLGTSPESATQRAINQATLLAHINSRLVEAPRWWTEAANGLDLFDDEPVREVYSLVLKAEADALTATKARADAAKADLKTDSK